MKHIMNITSRYVSVCFICEKIQNRGQGRLCTLYDNIFSSLLLLLIIFYNFLSLWLQELSCSFPLFYHCLLCFHKQFVACIVIDPAPASDPYWLPTIDVPLSILRGYCTSWSHLQSFSISFNGEASIPLLRWRLCELIAALHLLN